MKELLLNYLDGEIDAIQTIRTLSGMFNPDHSVMILSIICSITWIEQGDLNKELFKQLYKL